MKKEKIRGITFGSFDLCHYGHALMFEECKQYCDYLIVGVQSDPTKSMLLQAPLNAISIAFK